MGIFKKVDYRIKILEFANQRMCEGVSYINYRNFIDDSISDKINSHTNENLLSKLYVETFDTLGDNPEHLRRLLVSFYREYIDIKKIKKLEPQQEEKLRKAEKYLNEQYYMRSEAYFNLLEYKELKEARASSFKALVIAIAALAASIVASIWQIYSSTTIDQHQFNDLKNVIKQANLETKINHRQIAKLNRIISDSNDTFTINKAQLDVIVNTIRNRDQSAK